MKKKISFFSGLRAKIVLSLLIVGSFSVISGLSISYWSGTVKLRESMGHNFQGLSKEASRKTDLVIDREIDDNKHLSINPNIQLAVKNSNLHYLTHSAGTLQEWPGNVAKLWNGEDFSFKQTLMTNAASISLRKYMLSKETEYIALFATDEKGNLVGSVNGFPKFSYGEELWWKDVYNLGSGKIYIGDLFFNQKSQTWTVIIAVPVIEEESGKTIGVLAIFHDVHTLIQPSIQDIRFGETGHAMLIDSTGRVLSCPLMATGSYLSDKNLVNTVTSSSPGWVMAKDDGHGGRDSIIGFSPAVKTSAITLSSTGKKWHSFIRQDPKELYAPINTLLLSSSLSGILLIGVVALSGIILSKKIVRPIQLLQEGAEEIGKGKLNVHLDIRTNDEVELLANEFNLMAEKLKESYSTLEQKVEDRTRQLSVMVQQLEESGRFKTEFFSNISHELVTPLTSIIGYSELLQSKTPGNLNNTQMEHLSNIYNSGTHLLAVVSNLLDLSKIAAGKMEIHFGEFFIQNLIRNCIKTVAPLAAKKNQTLSTITEAGHLTLNADEVKVRQILFNLLSNAIKFSAPGSSIFIDAHPTTLNGLQAIEISVTDSGIGIREEDLPTIFEVFRQVDSSYTRKYQGSGLGLPIVKQFVEMHRGKIEVKSSLGKGSRFSVILPNHLVS
ncbi:MAG: ATP-binding protein [Nitrospiria bacterium]